MPTPTKGPRLGGGPAHERLMLANLATSLFEHNRITTTEAKAKRLRPLAERLITFAKRGDLHARRQVMTVIRDKDVVHKLFAEIGPQYTERPGGYTRIIKVEPRKGDNAPDGADRAGRGPHRRRRRSSRPASGPGAPSSLRAGRPGAARSSWPRSNAAESADRGGSRGRAAAEDADEADDATAIDDAIDDAVDGQQRDRGRSPPTMTRRATRPTTLTTRDDEADDDADDRPRTKSDEPKQAKPSS